MQATVLASEIIARFILFSRWIRLDGTVRQDAFIPDDRLELSVTRCSGVPEREIWGIAEGIARVSGRNLHGKADVGVAVVRSNSLDVKASPQAENPYHADVVNWPARKDEQKMAAMALAAVSQFRPPRLNPL